MKVNDIINNSSVWMPGRDYEHARPMVSVLLPTFRRAENGLFENAVLSVLNQTFRDLELIIVDDCSYDGTFELIRHFMELDGRVSCIRHTYNIGLPAISEYEAYLRARGAYLAFMFDDNDWHARAIEQTVELMEARGVKASYGVMDVFFPGSPCAVKLGTESAQDIVLYNNIANGSVVLHRDVLEDVGLYDPHLSIIRNCDWDLWNRITRSYDFLQTNIYFGRDYGPLQSDSLDSRSQLDAWFSTEHVSHPRNALLHPSCFGDYNIVESFGARSSFYALCMRESMREVEGKAWYRPLALPPVNPKHRRILVLINEPSASVVSFDRVLSPDITVRFVSLFHLYETDLAFADAVIISRDNMTAQRHLDLIKQLGIPVYYYTDDNFFILAEQMPEDTLAREFARANSREQLSRYDGVILSSEQLLNDFRARNLHDHLILLEPAINKALVAERTETEKPYFSVAFLGGSFRTDVLQNCVLPALKRLSEEIPVRLLCPNDFDLSEYVSERFSADTVPRTKCLDLILKKFRDFAPDVQVHCGKALPNNRFKTENALINAATIGAVLLSSEIEPYRSGQCRDCYLLAINTVEAWYSQLKLLATDTALRSRLYQNAKAYCFARYDVTHVWETLEWEILTVPEQTPYTIYRRMEQLIFQLRYRTIPAPTQPQQETNWQIFKLFWKKYGVLTLFIAAWKVVKKSTLWVIRKLKRK